MENETTATQISSDLFYSEALNAGDRSLFFFFFTLLSCAATLLA